jgi:hypothetical protein
MPPTGGILFSRVKKCRQPLILGNWPYPTVDGTARIGLNCQFEDQAN